MLLHEFGHVFAARRYGVQTPDITLLPIGGVARLERIPEKPSEELVVALAGPAVNVVIAALLFLALGGLPSMDDGTQVHNPGVDLLGRLAWVNISLVVFNLIPAFPMDGGRVLRALLASRLGYARGTRIAAGVGQAVAFALGLAGPVRQPAADLHRAVRLHGRRGGGERGADARREPRHDRLRRRRNAVRGPVAPTATVEDAVERLLRTSQHDFPVVDGAGRLRGVVTRDDMIRALRERGPDAPVLEVMRRDVPLLHHRQPLDEAMRTMQEGKHPAVGIVDAEGRLVGLVTPGEFRRADDGAGRPPAAPPAAAQPVGAGPGARLPSADARRRTPGLEAGRRRPDLPADMMYLLALVLPPLAILLSGRSFQAIFNGLLWVLGAGAAGRALRAGAAHPRHGRPLGADGRPRPQAGGARPALVDDALRRDRAQRSAVNGAAAAARATWDGEVVLDRGRGAGRARPGRAPFGWDALLWIPVAVLESVRASPETYGIVALGVLLMLLARLVGGRRRD